jgi:hypothetical protein
MTDGRRSATLTEPGVAGPVARLLDEAHAQLGPTELAQVLLALEEPAGRLAGAPAALGGDPVELSAPALAVVLSIRRLIDEAGEARSAEGRARLGAWLVDYLHEVAARPRGAALAAAA